jgi:XTP/dITP diphosphohydrolase
VLFSLVNYARWHNINPDDALEKTNIKFKQRFEAIEAYARTKGKKMQDMTLAEMDEIWEQAKK